MRVLLVGGAYQFGGCCTMVGKGMLEKVEGRKRSNGGGTLVVEEVPGLAVVGGGVSSTTRNSVSMGAFRSSGVTVVLEGGTVVP